MGDAAAVARAGLATAAACGALRLVIKHREERLAVQAVVFQARALTAYGLFTAMALAVLAVDAVRLA